MLFRILIVCVCVTGIWPVRAQSLDRQLVGKWRDELGGEKIFRSDHTVTERSEPYTWNGTWRVRGNQLTTVTRCSAWPHRQYIDKCLFTFRGDHLIFGMHDLRKKEHGREVDHTEPFMTGVTYRRVR